MSKMNHRPKDTDLPLGRTEDTHDIAASGTGLKEPRRFGRRTLALTVGFLVLAVASIASAGTFTAQTEFDPYTEVLPQDRAAAIDRLGADIVLPPGGNFDALVDVNWTEDERGLAGTLAFNATETSLAYAANGRATANDYESLRTRLFEPSKEPGEARHTRHEQIIVDCMSARGFEYVALPYAGMTKVLELKQSLSAKDFAQQYGYGGATLYEEDEIASATINASFVNPNDSIRDAMSSSELAAYFLAFAGPPRQGGESEDGSYQSADPQEGCKGQAGIDVYGGPRRSELSSEARLAIEGIERAAQSNDDVQAARADWSQCMSERGYDVRSEEGIYALLDSWLRPVLATGATKTVKVSGFDGEPITVTVPAPDPAELAEVGQLEIALAVADVECDASSGLSIATNNAREAAQLRVVTDWYDQLVASTS